MVLTGYIVSIPIFCDSAFVILSPLVKALARSSGKSVLTLGIAGRRADADPPCRAADPGSARRCRHLRRRPGADDLLKRRLFHPGMAVIVFYARAMSPRIERMILNDTGEDLGAAYCQFETAAEERQRVQPSLGLSILPLVLPIALIFLNTIATTIVRGAEMPNWRTTSWSRPSPSSAP